jgi:hypothetical protein
MDVANFAGDLVNASNVDSKTLTRGQSLPGELQKNALEDRGHREFSIKRASCYNEFGGAEL